MAIYPSDPKEGFAILRHNHYVAGRIALFSGQLQPAAMLLGYALEFSLKGASAGVDPKRLSSGLRKQLHLHDLPALIAETIAAGLLPSLDVSADFWEFASDHLNQRYPTQQRTVHERQQALGRLAVMSIGHVEYYDDAMLQIDDALASQQGITSSIVGRIVQDIDSFSTRAFLHSNGPAMRRLTASHALGERAGELWSFSAMPSALAKPYTEDSATFACSFKYPSPFATTKDGKPTLVIPIVEEAHPISTKSGHPLSIGTIVFGPGTFLPSDDLPAK